MGNSTFLNHSLSHRKERVPDVFTGTKGSLKDWLRHFETCARWNRWDYAVGITMQKKNIHRVEFRSRFTEEEGRERD